ncbi:hypothetical protein I9Y31_003339 [Clostridium perfringens]|nr:hypothetical protein [Clostridium perfringens]
MKFLFYTFIWICINSEYKPVRIFRYLVFILGINQIWSSLKIFNFNGIVEPIFCITILFFPRMLCRVNELLEKRKTI